ncbi:MAG: hypothetical protein K1Y36_29385, partial [Blastocatellia bacterium]|nr:hypothetical protein [Blastocatellia bacterium]
LLLLLLPVEYYWYTSEKNTLTQANQHEDENLVKNEDVANKVKILEQHINDVNLIRDATNTLIQGQKTNLQVLTSLYICATAKQGLVLSRVESKGRQLVGTGLVDMGGILAAQSPGSTASPQPPVQKEKPVSDLIADMRQSGDFDPEITFSFTNNQHGDQAEFTIYARYAKHVEVPSLDKLVVPRLVEPYRNLTSTPTQTAQK